MKKSLVILLVVICSKLTAQNNFTETVSTVKIGAGYTRDFPGMSGFGITADYAHKLNDYLEGGFGFKRLDMSGYPRTSTVNEFTKATTLDFNIYYLPLVSESSSLKIGAGYSFSFYKTRRSYPVIETVGTEKSTAWPIQDAKGKSSGIIITAEYEYSFSPGLSLGVKGSFCKAYDRVFYIGPFVGIHL